jgi:hypothetical protein
MILDAFHRQPDPPEVQPSEPKPGTPGEFTQLFGVQNPVVPAPPPPPAAAPQQTSKPSSEEATRIFVRQAAPPADPPPVRMVAMPASPSSSNPPRMKGFSSPGASDSASADGSFTQLFRAVQPSPPTQPPIQPLPVQASSLSPAEEKTEWPTSAPKSPGATELFRALSGSEGSPVDRSVRRPDIFSGPGPAQTAPGSVTMWIQKLSEDIGPASPPQAFEPQPLAAMPEPVPLSGQGEYTRIISGDAVRAVTAVPSPPVLAAPKVQAPAIEPKAAGPKLSPPAVSPPRSKLQEMMPILLVLNAFLLVVLILMVIFAVLRK